MSIQTPEQIATRLADSVMWSSDKTALLSGERLERIITSAILADRAQRTVPQLLADDLENQADQWDGEDVPQVCEIYREAAAFLRKHDGEEPVADIVGDMLWAAAHKVREITNKVEVEGQKN